MTLTHAIIFDLDDTLYPECEFTFSGYRAVASAFADRMGVGGDDLILRMQQLFDSPDRNRVFDVVVKEAGSPDSDKLVPEMVAHFRNHEPSIELHADARILLDQIAGQFQLGIISDGPCETQAIKVAALGLDSRIDHIILTDRWGRSFWKPHVRAFEEMTNQLDLAPQFCTYVADNPAKDFVAPNKLGWQTVRIVRPDGIYRTAIPAPNGQPQTTICSLDDLSLPD